MDRAPRAIRLLSLVTLTHFFFCFNSHVEISKGRIWVWKVNTLRSTGEEVRVGQ